jgi:hypothetical protein
MRSKIIATKKIEAIFGLIVNDKIIADITVTGALNPIRRIMIKAF